MANINDYLIWRGDIPINKEFPFNEIDDMILARFSYLLFNRIDLKKEETIESISKKMKDFPNEDFRYNGDKELITNLGVSNRFKNMVVTDFVENTDKTNEVQFSAITVHISNKEMYLSYIGTDDSIVGWKEDFNLSFMQNVPSQFDGVNYLNKIAEKFPEKKMRIGGHSKGGNVAVFSSISTTKRNQNRIISVCNYDGPGFDKTILEEYKNNSFLNKIVTYIPQESVIGRLLEHEEKVVIIKSTEKGIYQHDIYSWQIIRNEMVKYPELTNSSEVIYKTIREWLKQTTPEQRKIFVDSIFELFYATSLTTFGEFSSTWRKNVPLLFKTYKGLSEKDRKIISKMIREFGKAYAITLKDSETFKVENLKKSN